MQTKLFIGTRLTPELKTHLGQTHTERLEKIPYEGKEYLGFYLEKGNPSVEELRAQCDHFIETLQGLLPHFRTDNVPVLIFPQLFVG